MLPNPSLNTCTRAKVCLNPIYIHIQQAGLIHKEIPLLRYSTWTIWISLGGRKHPAYHRSNISNLKYNKSPHPQISNRNSSLLNCMLFEIVKRKKKETCLWFFFSNPAWEPSSPQCHFYMSVKVLPSEGSSSNPSTSSGAKSHSRFHQSCLKIEAVKQWSAVSLPLNLHFCAV